MPDVDAHICPADIFITEMADLADTETGRIHDNYHGLLLDVGHCADKCLHFILCRDKRKIGVEFADGQLCRIPWLVEYIHCEKTELSDDAVHRPVREIPFVLYDIKKFSLIVVCDL